jgi:hypothetical protein
LEIPVTSKWPKVMLMSAATSAWLIYDMATATEAPRQALAILQYGRWPARCSGWPVRW